MRPLPIPLSVERPNQVWAMDITYIPMAKGFVYLAVVIDWSIRRWRQNVYACAEVRYEEEFLQMSLVVHADGHYVTGQSDHHRRPLADT